LPQQQKQGSESPLITALAAGQNKHCKGSNHSSKDHKGHSITMWPHHMTKHHHTTASKAPREQNRECSFTMFLTHPQEIVCILPMLLDSASINHHRLQVQAYLSIQSHSHRHTADKAKDTNFKKWEQMQAFHSLTTT